MDNKENKKIKVPHVYILLLFIVLILSILSYIVPAGQYSMKTLDGHEIVDASTFHFIKQTPVTFMQFLTAVPRGMQETAQIIFFIFIVGGTMSVITETKAIEAAMGRVIKGMSSKKIFIIPIVMIFFSLCGGVFGMAEETIPFIPIFVALAVGMGYDSITGTAMVFCGASAGFAGAFMNPFTVQVAQSIAELPLLSSMKFRIIMYLCMTTITIAYVMIYAHKVNIQPEQSLMYDFDCKRDDVVDVDELPEFGIREKTILTVFAIGMVIIIVNVMKNGWYMEEIAAVFLCMSFIVAIVAKMGVNQYAEILSKGMKDIASGALVVGFARAILVVMTDGNILHTILYSASGILGSLPTVISAIGMYIFQCLLNFLVPSGSGQAAVSIPIMAPLGDIVGISRQTSVIAFQLGDGISNIFTPTSGYFMAGLAMAKIPWTKWAKWILPLIAIQYLLGAIFVIVAASIKLGPF